MDLKTEHLQQSWLKADKKIRPAIITIIWILDFFFPLSLVPICQAHTFCFPEWKEKHAKFSIYWTLLGWYHRFFSLQSDCKSMVTITLIPHSHNYWSVLIFKILLTDNVIFFPWWTFFKSYNGNTQASCSTHMIHNSEFKDILLFFTTNPGIQFSSSCSTTQEKFKSSKMRRKGCICTLITCLDLLHVNQTFKPHQHTRNYSVLLTSLSDLICDVLYVREIYGNWFWGSFFLF